MSSDAAKPSSPVEGGSSAPTVDEKRLSEVRLRRRLTRSLARAVTDFSMFADGDRVMVAVSGGKDSYVLNELLRDLERRAPVKFSLTALNVDQGHPGYPGHLLTDYMAKEGFAFDMVHEDTYTIVKEKVPEGKTTCSLCSRLRRGILYRIARERGFNKIALGHHRDDIVTTLMMNLMFSGQLKAMPPKLINDAGDVTVLRPLAFCAEDDIAAFAEMRRYPIIPCTLCGSQPNHQRRLVGELLAELERRQPNVRASMMAALANVRPSHLLDAGLWAKLGLSAAQDIETEPPAESGFVPVGRLAESRHKGA